MATPVITATLPNINAGAFIRGAATSWTTGVASGGADTVTIASGNLPVHTHDINHTHGAFTSGAGSAHSHANTASSGAGSAHTHTAGQNTYQVAGPGYTDAIGDHIHSYYSGEGSSATRIPSSDGDGNIAQYAIGTSQAGGHQHSIGNESSHTHTITMSNANESSHTHSTTISALGVTASGNGGFANSAVAILPTYFSAVYYIRVK